MTGSASPSCKPHESAQANEPKESMQRGARHIAPPAIGIRNLDERPSFIGADVGDIGHPDLVRLADFELPGKVVGRANKAGKANDSFLMTTSFKALLKPRIDLTCQGSPIGGSCR
ncbi:MAG: hypothetical protein ACN6OP_18155 [Pseudomonadales bacterium]